MTKWCGTICSKNFSSNKYFGYDHVRKLKIAIILMKNALYILQINILNNTNCIYPFDVKNIYKIIFPLPHRNIDKNCTKIFDDILGRFHSIRICTILCFDKTKVKITNLNHDANAGCGKNSMWEKI